MTNRSLAQPVPPSTRELRGLALYRDHADEVEPLGKGVYRVPGCSGGSYTVDLAVFGGTESCNCPDFQRYKEPCKHVYAGSLYRSKARAAARREQAERTKARATRGNVAALAASL